jgi:hypothetical protein
VPGVAGWLLLSGDFSKKIKAAIVAAFIFLREFSVIC